MIHVQTEDFDIGDEVAALTQGRSDIGAVVTFSGIVRDVEDAAGFAGLRPSDRRGRARITEVVGSEGISKLSVSPREWH